jgi:hypothetical protein
MALKELVYGFNSYPEQSFTKYKLIYNVYIIFINYNNKTKKHLIGLEPISCDAENRNFTI